MTLSQGVELVRQLREGTLTAWQRVEETPWARAAASGTLPRSAWSAAMACRLPIYATLEHAMSVDPQLRTLLVPKLARASVLRKDVPLRVSGAEAGGVLAHLWVARIQDVAVQQPCRLLAHMWVRHLADLGPGRATGLRLAKVWGDEPAFYRLDGVSIEDVHARWREVAGATVVSASHVDGLIEEARWALDMEEAILAAMPVASGASNGPARRWADTLS